MNRQLKSTASVLVATALTAMAIFAGVGVADVVVGTSDAGYPTATTGNYTNVTNVSQSSGSLTCPRTGCTASTCHATTGMPPGQ